VARHGHDYDADGGDSDEGAGNQEEESSKGGIFPAHNLTVEESAGGDLHVIWHSIGKGSVFCGETSPEDLEIGPIN
jgi:hypothetical protein